MSEPKIFISYSRRDADWARSFAEALNQRGVRVWFDQFQVAPGDALREAVEAGLRESDVFVALLDPEHPVNPNLYFELGAAIGMGKRIVTIVPRELEAANLPFDIRSRRYLTRESPEDTAEELAHSLAA